MPRDISLLIARATGKRPPVVLPFAFTGLFPFDPVTGGWPRQLYMPKGMGMVAFRCWYEIGEPANDSEPCPSALKSS